MIALVDTKVCRVCYITALGTYYIMPNILMDFDILADTSLVYITETTSLKQHIKSI